MFKTHGTNSAEQLLERQLQLTEAITGQDQPTDILDQVLEIALTLDSVDGVCVWFMDESTGQMELRQYLGMAPEAAERLACIPTDASLYNQVVLGREVVGDWEYAWEELAILLRRDGWTDVGVWPLRYEETSVGAICALSRDGDGLAPGAARLLRSSALQLGALIGRARLEADLRNSRFNLDQLFANFEDLVFIVQPNGKILYCNCGEAGHPDLGTDNPAGHDIEDYLPGAAQPGNMPLAGLESAASRSWTGRMRQASGRLHPVEVRSFEGRWNQRTVRYILCRDLSRERVMEKERTRLIMAIEQSADSIIITDGAGTIQYTNPAFTRLTGYEKEEALGQNPRLLKSDKHGAQFYRQMWQALSRGEVWKGRITNRRKDGQEFAEFATISPVRDDSGIITHFVAVKRDVTGEVEMEERLRLSQKMEAIGTLAGGLAHDFNNILYAILGYCQLGLDDAPVGHPARQSIEEIRKAGERASALVAKMLTLGCRNEGAQVVTDLQPLVQEALDLARASLPTTIEFDVELEKSKQGVKCDPTQIHQVVLNLCTNAEHAMRPQGGRLTVRLDTVTTEGADRLRWPQLDPGPYARLVIADTGAGMDPETRHRIFEPYFTTKDANEGSGLGLATVQGIILNHAGRIYVESEPQVGTTFTLFFPVSCEDVVKPEDREDQNVKRRGSGTVMVVDDEEMIVEVVTKSLVKLGFQVHGFTEPVKALEHFQQDPRAVDIVVTDQTMPRLTGFELAARMLSIREDLPIVMTTGYSEQLLDIDLAEAGIALLLPKPLKIAKLADAVIGLVSANPPKLEV